MVVNRYRLFIVGADSLFIDYFLAGLSWIEGKDRWEVRFWREGISEWGRFGVEWEYVIQKVRNFGFDLDFMLQNQTFVLNCVRMLKRNLKYLRKRKGMSQGETASEIGIARSALASYENGRSEPKAGILMKLADFFKVNIHDLLYSDFDTPLFNKKGSVAKSLRNQEVRILTVTINEQKKQNIEFVPVSAIAGYAQNFVEPDFVKELPRFSLPKLSEGHYRAFEIKGDSMPPINENYVVIGQFVEHFSNLKNGKRYILLTKEDGLVFKRVFSEVTQNQRLILMSDNPEYNPYSVRIDTVLEAWEMKAFIGYANNESNIQQAILDKLHSIEQKIEQIKTT